MVNTVVEELCLDLATKYQTDGFYHPLRVLSEEDASKCREDIELVEKNYEPTIGGKLRHKPHLLLTSLDQAVRNKTILDVVEELIGPDIFVWASLLFIKEPGDKTYVSLHQDSTYWGLSDPTVVTVWIALSKANKESGAMQMVPGSHRLNQLDHRETYDKNNLLTRGQEVSATFDSSNIIDIELELGECSLHHVRTIHGSQPNISSDRRIGFAIRYIPTSVYQLYGRDSALLVRGNDEYRNFDHEISPKQNLSRTAIKRYINANESHNAILFKGAKGPQR